MSTCPQLYLSLLPREYEDKKHNILHFVNWNYWKSAFSASDQTVQTHFNRRLKKTPHNFWWNEFFEDINLIWDHFKSYSKVDYLKGWWCPLLYFCNTIFEREKNAIFLFEQLTTNMKYESILNTHPDWTLPSPLPRNWNDMKQTYWWVLKKQNSTLKFPNHLVLTTQFIYNRKC